MSEHKALQANACYQINESVVTRCIVGETLLVPIAGKLANIQEIFSLNETGAYIWSKFDGHTSLGDICQRLVDEFEVDEWEAREDISALIEHLSELELIERMDV
ncbi:MAG: PqqD family peptide modification chaperone [Gammaproteobacteria bacterium]|nr:PqqD family peptide modification chaperone [Gammaproteobacteria bacterium]